MRTVKNVLDFYRDNDTDLKRIVTKICHDMQVPTWTDDITQEIYRLLVSKEILVRYNPDRLGYNNKTTKLSTYIYRVIINTVRAHKMDRANHFELNTKSSAELGLLAASTHQIHTDYSATLYASYLVEPTDGLSFDLDRFEEYLVKTNKRYTLSRRRFKGVDCDGISLLDVFNLIRNGYTSREIAKKYGCSEMFICTVKNEIKFRLLKFGFVWGLAKK